MKALLRNIKGLNREVLICDIQPYEVPTIRYLIENTEDMKVGTKIHMSNWSDSNDYIVTRFDTKVEIQPIGMNK